LLLGNPGDALPVLVKTITQGQLQNYAQASADFNPLHLDATFAATTQFGGVIAHGMLTLAFISEMMAAAFGRAWLESGALQVRFNGAAYLGDQVETWGRVTKVEETMGESPLLAPHRLVVCSVGVRNCQSGQELVSGTASVRLAGPRETE
jgi:3-hydroxybutyryl-CoA dehydratase